jgi:hypothetical protein
MSIRFVNSVYLNVICSEGIPRHLPRGTGQPNRYSDQAAGLRPWNRVSITSRGKVFLPSPTLSRPSLASTHSVDTEAVNGRGVNPTTHVQLVPRLKMSGVVSPLPHTPSWRGKGKLLLFLEILRKPTRCHV